ncbi:Hsp20/alpha crystallin family protein [Waterburya agarophytonicola K14]|uniref:Hsp20/alpha crystallin family protein n=1 Tax=Waterburya agarophytonicola KI4 TaxID=2874699 RepID=A0A964BT95_9CYAN|nr:Hsp20/alpha crystallin family protein [Waterburya agarophytonicola]MCC0177767.1 Hsp20/alpha crystallin family protein [Waterburya agarophytonicola KI4]
MKESSKTWCPAIELNQTDRDLILKAEIPGVDIKHLNISAEPNSIAISGVHDRHQSTVEQEVIPSELHYGQLDCSVPLPEAIQVNHVRAELIDGVLTITMPKVNIANPAKI